MSRDSLSRIAPMNVLYKFFSLDYFLDAVVRCELQTIELWGAAPHVYVEEMSLADIARIRKEINKRQLNVCCFTPEITNYPINIAAQEVHVRKRSIDYMLKSMQVAAELDIKLMQISSGSGYYNEPTDEAWKRSRNSLETIVKQAELLGIQMSLEPLLSHDSNLVNSVPSAQKMLEDIASPFLGILIDTVTMAASGDSLNDYFKAFGSQIKHVQLCDGPGGHLTWGDGSLKLHDYLQALKQCGYEGYLGLEIYDHSYYVNPDKALTQGIDMIKTCLL
jgi:protein FrlC